MRNDLKKAIILWLLENGNVFGRLNACVEHFRPYIYDATGNHLEFGGEDTYNFICAADKLLYDRNTVIL